MGIEQRYLQHLSGRYFFRTKDGWYFEGYYKRRRNGMRNYVILCIKPPRQPGIFIAERRVNRKLGKTYGFMEACKEFKKELRRLKKWK
jgi:hypothetical protein